MNHHLGSLVGLDYGSDDSENDSHSPTVNTIPQPSTATPLLERCAISEPSERVNDPEPLQPAAQAVIQEHSATLQQHSFPWPPTVSNGEDWNLSSNGDATKSDELLQAKVADWHQLMHHQQLYFNDRLLGSKAFRNPHLYAKLVEFLDLDELGSNFSASDYDPHSFPPTAYAEAIVQEQRRRAEERALAHQARTQISFASAGSASPALPNSSRAKPSRWDMPADSPSNL